jgi:hypothetical protein
VIAQLGERQTEDLKVPGSIPGRGNVTLFLEIYIHCVPNNNKKKTVSESIFKNGGTTEIRTRDLLFTRQAL